MKTLQRCDANHANRCISARCGVTTFPIPPRCGVHWVAAPPWCHCLWGWLHSIRASTWCAVAQIRGGSWQRLPSWVRRGLHRGAHELDDAPVPWIPTDTRSRAFRGTASANHYSTPRAERSYIGRTLGKKSANNTALSENIVRKETDSISWCSQKRWVCGGVNMANGGAKSTIWRCKYWDRVKTSTNTNYGSIGSLKLYIRVDLPEQHIGEVPFFTACFIMVYQVVVPGANV